MVPSTVLRMLGPRYSDLQGWLLSVGQLRMVLLDGCRPMLADARMLVLMGQPSTMLLTLWVDAGLAGRCWEASNHASAQGKGQ